MPAKVAREAAVPVIDELELTATTEGILARHPAVGLAVGVVRDGRLELFAERLATGYEMGPGRAPSSRPRSPREQSPA